MRFIIGEGWETWVNQLSSDGTIGLFYNTTGGGILAYLIFSVVCILALIGLFTVLKWLFIGLPKKKKASKW